MPASDDLARWFSQERMTTYRRACDGDPDRAEELYVWNADLSAALWRTLGHIEVLLRNAMHNELEAWSTKQHGDPCWYRTTTEALHINARREVTTAITRATRTGLETPGRVVAELSLGFWRYLLSARYDPTLWRWCLYRAFPGHRGPRREVEGAVADLHQLRNRIAHVEPLHHLPVARRHATMLTVAGWIDPDAQKWISTHDHVPAVLAARP